MQQAQLAGRQAAAARQWLQDRRASTASPTRPTGAALADFRKRMNLAPNAGNADLFDALETEALQDDRARRLCRLQRHAPRRSAVALGAEDGGKTGLARLVEDRGRRLRQGDHRRRCTPTRSICWRRRPGGAPLVGGPQQVLHHRRRVRDPGPRELRQRAAWPKPALPRRNVKGLRGYHRPYRRRTGPQ